MIILPNHKGVLEVYVVGSGLVWSETLPENVTTHPAWPGIQQVLQGDYRNIYAHSEILARGWLGEQQRKYRLTSEQASDLLIPDDLPKEVPSEPKAIAIFDDFSRAA